MASERHVCGARIRRGAFLLALVWDACGRVLTAQTVAAPTATSTEVASKLKVYDVVSVKENKSSDGMVRMMNTPDGFNTTNMNLQNLISNAYGIRLDLIYGGPAWVESRGFDVEAKVAGPDIDAYKKLGEKDRNDMMKAILKERFGLQANIQTKELPVYDLVVAKGGLKMKEAPPDPSQNATLDDLKPDTKSGKSARHNGNMSMSMSTMTGEGLPMLRIANQISYIVHRTVLDKTGLAGLYDFELKWTPEEDAAKQDNGADTAPSIFTAVQEQLGLKLQSTKGPVDTLVIDHVELPSEN